MSAPWLLTPGPLTTSDDTRAAMRSDWGSRDAAFVMLTAGVRGHLCKVAHAEAEHTCVPLQGSGTFAVESMLGTLVPSDGRVLVLSNGAYGRRMVEICRRIGRAVTVHETPEDSAIAPDTVAAALANDPAGHVAIVHCETTTGVLNPLEDIAAVVARHDRRLLVDAMSSFGTVEIDAREIAFDGLAASANKGLEGVPGVAFVLGRRVALEGTAGTAPSLSLDLHDQWRGFEANGQWRFTPPTHVIAALAMALAQLDQEGGVAARHARYAANCATLRAGMTELGFRPLLDEAVQAPVIVTFHAPEDPAYDFAAFYDALLARGYAIYPGKLTDAETFRIGCIGAVGEAQMTGVVEALRDVMAAQGFRP